MNLDPKQKKIAWICIAAVVVINYAPSVITAVMQQGQGGSRPSPFAQKAPVPPAVLAAAPFRDLLGQYAQNRLVLPARGLCSMHFELRLSREKQGAFSGYPTLTCSTPHPWNTPHVPRLSAAILTGLPENGNIRFQGIDELGGDCVITDFVVRRFGVSQIAIQFHDCLGSTTILLNRTGR